MRKRGENFQKTRFFPQKKKKKRNIEEKFLVAVRTSKNGGVMVNIGETKRHMAIEGNEVPTCDCNRVQD